ncbi:MlaD family protein [Variovorax ginsengisoli]|uniref:MlaD family protein n=1 Tax=Variovorax ginsengisoli TaxID=363844 RepID=A0ABT8SB70_9BURK|nr:MlaD family protein [Variovorax ginsengisoli]MDN8616893.1 MlaD family protein [Variovorax ginsengisoli]MDO1536063.1 MlaD family protein [Variovorax ginsengisoli]
MKRNALLIGGFVVAALVITVAAILWLSGNDLFTRQQRARVFYQGNVSGLSVGAPVTFRGVTIGQVTDIGILMDPISLKTTVPVTLRLQPSALRLTDAKDKVPALPELVQRGLRARLASQSIVTGQKAIELDFLPDTPDTLLGGPGATEIPAVADRFGALIDQVANLPLRDTVADMRQAIQALEATLASVQKTLDSAQGVLGGAARQLDLTAVESRKTLAVATEAIRQVQGSSQATLKAITQLADSSQQTVLAAQPELQRTLVGARQASETAKLAMERLADMAAPGAPLRGDFDATLSDLSQAARSLRSLSEQLEERPNAIIFGNPRQ